MTIKSIVYLIVLLLLSVNHGMGGMGIQSFEKEEQDWDFKRYQLLKQSSIKTIKTTNGGVYDCVDFYEQPAFDHPLLKNHIFHPQMRPNYSNGSIKNLSSKDNADVKCNVESLQDGGCPTGTVPIRRVSNDEFIHMKSFMKDYALTRKLNSLNSNPGVQFAVLQTSSNTTKYNGVRGIFNYYQLSIEAPQYSSGEMIIQNGNDMIIVGWTVNPTIYKDDKVHLFQYLTTGQKQCFNTACGFISTNKDLPVDSEMIGSSQRGVQKEVSLFVYQDVKNEIWWLECCGIIVGFWPNKILSTLANGATYIAIGGEAYAAPGQPLPPMGNGYYPSQYLDDTAFWRNITVLDANHQHIIPQQTDLHITDSQYGVYELGMHGKEGRTVGYGGTIM